MGLDMYLSKKIFFGLNNEHNIEPNKKTQIIINGVEQPTKDLTYITYSVMYWRKANHIHNWFVNNIQDGDDNCKEYYVDKEQLQELLDVCKKVKESLEASKFEESEEEEDFFTKEKFRYKIFTDTEVAEELLPTTPGFFFGNTNYNSYYLNDLNDTIEGLEKVIAEDNPNAEFYYRSSW
jgi:hypothetical protein